MIPEPRPLAAQRGAALVVVLWALVALSGLALAASVGAVIDLRLAVRHREHAAALATAETGLAQALAALRVDPSRAARVDSVQGAGPAGSWIARWHPSGGGVRVLAEGSAGSAGRAVEVRAVPSGGAWIVRAWREIR
ncbi:hypothetical protein BH20GEM1_BH20GEM1_08540 [soil metagenome]